MILNRCSKPTKLKKITATRKKVCFSILISLTRAKLVDKCFGKVYILIFNINFGC